jgi:uncharacterized repeat protein (TIGR03803 family)
MNINPPPGPFIAPGQIGSVLQSGDGNFYASASGVCGVNAGGFCDYILRIDALGAVTTLHTFELDGSNNTNDDGSSITQLLEARDGALYGTAKKGGPYGTGTIFRITHDGTFSLLQDYPFRTYGYGGYGTSYHCGNYYSYTAPAYTVGGYPGPLTEGADGNLYGLQHNGNASGASTQGAFFRITPGGDFSVIRNFVPVNSYLSGGDGPGNCGATVVSTPNDPVFITADFAVDPPQLLQALDGSFYAQMTGSDTSEELDTLARLPGNQAVPVYNLSSNGAAGCGSNAPLIEGSNGGLYSYTTSGDFVFLNGNLQLFNSTRLPLAVLGSDTNFYTTTTGSAGSYNGNITQVSPLGASSIFADIRNSDANAAVQTGYGSGPVSEAANGNLVGGAVGYDSAKPAAQATTYFLFNVPTSGQLTGPIHLSFPSATAKVNQAVVLTWTVSNVFSLTAQQCHATVQQPAQGSAANAGN